MAQFRYTAINQQNKKLTGIINARDEIEARSELNTIGFSILNLEKIAEEEESKEQEITTKYRFEAIDKSGKKILGSIRSKDIFLAYSRLIEEYNFHVQAIYPENATEEEIRLARETEIPKLEKRYKELDQEQKKIISRYETEEYEKKKQKLLHHIDQIIIKVKQWTQELMGEIQPEVRTNIKKEIDRLLRLKTSSNLEYLKQLAEDLIKIFIKDENYIDDEKNVEKKIKIRIAAKLLLKELDHYSAKKLPFRKAMLVKIKKWQEENIEKVKSPRLMAQFSNIFLKIIYYELYEESEIVELKEQLSLINKKIREYTMIFLFGNIIQKKIIRPIRIELKQEKNEIKKKLTQKKKSFSTQYHVPYRIDRHLTERCLNELHTFTGWLLAFYLLFYFLGGYFIQKNISMPIKTHFFFFNAQPFQFTLALLFLLHSAVGIKIHFFQKNIIATFIIIPSTFITALIIIYNF